MRSPSPSRKSALLEPEAPSRLSGSDAYSGRARSTRARTRFRSISNSSSCSGPVTVPIPSARGVGVDRNTRSAGPRRRAVAAPTVLRTSSRLLFDTLAGVFDDLGFDVVGDDCFRDLVIARVVEPTSLLDVDRVLADLGRVSASLSTRKRTLRRAHQGQYRDQIATACFAHAATSGDVSLVLYDVTVRHEALVVRMEVRGHHRGRCRSGGRGAGVSLTANGFQERHRSGNAGRTGEHRAPLHPVTHETRTAAPHEPTPADPGSGCPSNEREREVRPGELDRVRQQRHVTVRLGRRTIGVDRNHERHWAPRVALP